MNILAINEAIELLSKISPEVVFASDFGWRTVTHAKQHLEKQVVEYFSPEVAS